MTGKSCLAMQLDGALAVLTLDRPKALNALNAALLDALDESLDRAACNPETRVVILSGGDSVFSVGGDLKEDHADAGQRVARMHALTLRLRAYPKISIAAIEGWALGGGLELAMACTFRVAAPGAGLGLPEVKLGLIPGFGGTQLLPRLVGASRALEMLCSGDPLDSATAHRIGLVDRVADAPGGALACARAYAALFAGHSEAAQRAARACVEEGHGLALAAALDIEAGHVNRLRGTGLPAGIDAFRRQHSA